MSEIHDTLTVDDIKKIFHVGEGTVYRWVAASRSGKGRFPPPIGGPKQRLRWCRESIINYQNATNIKPQSKPETASQRKKRCEAAIQSLKRMGVNIDD